MYLSSENFTHVWNIPRAYNDMSDVRSTEVSVEVSHKNKEKKLIQYQNQTCKDLN